MKSTNVYLEKLELLCTNNKLTFRYIMSASLFLQNKFRVFKMRSHLRGPRRKSEGNPPFLFPFFLITIYSRLRVDRVSNELVNVESRHVRALKFRTGMIYIAILNFLQPTTAEEQ